MFKPHPLRRQLKRVKGFRLSEGGVNCARPANWAVRTDHWGNPFTAQSFLDAGQAETLQQAKEMAFKAHQQWLLSPPQGDGVYLKDLWRWTRFNQHKLRGRLLYCWCAPDAPCHADTLARWANPRELVSLDECITSYPAGTVLIRYRAFDGYVEDWALPDDIGPVDELALRNYLGFHKQKALFLDWRVSE